MGSEDKSSRLGLDPSIFLQVELGSMHLPQMQVGHHGQGHRYGAVPQVSKLWQLSLSLSNQRKYRLSLTFATMVQPKSTRWILLVSFQDNLQAILTNVSTFIAVEKFQSETSNLDGIATRPSILEKTARSQNFSDAKMWGLIFSEHLCDILPFTIKCNKCRYFVHVAIAVGGDDQDESHPIWPGQDSSGMQRSFPTRWRINWDSQILGWSSVWLTLFHK